MKVKVIDHTVEVEQQLRDSIHLALTAVGLFAVDEIVEKLQSGYGKQIWITGDLVLESCHY